MLTGNGSGLFIAAQCKDCLPFTVKLPSASRGQLVRLKHDSTQAPNGLQFVIDARRTQVASAGMVVEFFVVLRVSEMASFGAFPSG